MNIVMIHFGERSAIQVLSQISLQVLSQIKVAKRIDLDVDVEPNHQKPSATAGAFFLQRHPKPINQPPIPGTIPINAA